MSLLETVKAFWRFRKQTCERLAALEGAVKKLAQDQTALDATIAGLPQSLSAVLTPAVTSAVQASISPIIESLKTKNATTPVDFTPEITSLMNLPSALAASLSPTIASSVAASLNPPAATTQPVPGSPAPADTGAGSPT